MAVVDGSSLVVVVVVVEVVVVVVVSIVVVVVANSFSIEPPTRCVLNNKEHTASWFLFSLTGSPQVQNQPQTSHTGLVQHCPTQISFRFTTIAAPIRWASSPPTPTPRLLLPLRHLLSAIERRRRAFIPLMVRQIRVIVLGNHQQAVPLAVHVVHRGVDLELSLLGLDPRGSRNVMQRSVTVMVTVSNGKIATAGNSKV